MEREQSMGKDCDLPAYLWTEAISHATYLVNRSPTRANSRMIPEAKYTGTNPDLSSLKIFGCLVYVHIPKDARKKVDSKTHACMFLGIDSETKAYRLFDNKRKKVVISRDTICDETRLGFKYISQNEPSSLNYTLLSSNQTNAREPSESTTDSDKTCYR